MAPRQRYTRDVRKHYCRLNNNSSGVSSASPTTRVQVIPAASCSPGDTSSSWMRTGTRWASLPDDFPCPECFVREKPDFLPLTDAALRA